MEKESTVASNKNIIGFGIGQIGSGLFFNFMSMYMLFFYTNVMGINIAVAGIIFMVARIVDAFSDPLLGMIADRTNTKIGKFRPFLRYGAPIASAALILMFLAPDLSMPMKIVYAYTTYIIGSLARTVVDTPYHSIVTLLSTNPDQRSRIVGIKNLVGMIGILMVMPVMNFVDMLGGGVLAWRTLAIIYAVVVTVSYWLCSSMIKDKDIYIPEATGVTKTKVKVADQLKTIFKNKTILMLVISFATDSFAYQLVGAINVYYFMYNLGNKQGLIALTQIPSIAGMVIAAIGIKFFVQKFGKRIAMIGIETILIIPNIIIFLLPSSQLNGIMAAIMIMMFFQIFAQVIAWSILPDCADYAELMFKVKAAATITSTFTFMNKASQALGVFVSGLILSSLGFVEGAATQSEAVMDGILYLRTLIPIAAYIISIIAMQFYPLKRKDEEEMEVKIQEIRAEELRLEAPVQIEVK